MATRDEAILEAFGRVRSWTRGDERAPHKPLLLLMALARVQRGGGRLLAFEEVEGALSRLLDEFGPDRSSTNPHYPFWRLRNDGIWEVPEAAALAARENASGDVPVTALREARARGGLIEEVHDHLASRPELVNRLAGRILDDAFPPSLHQEVLDAVGFPWVVVGRRRPRDPRFREEVLRIYERRCAVCGYGGRLGTADLALEAGHIKWHAAGGPDEPDNGMALCSFHHVSLDRGALTVDDELRVQVSQQVAGREMVDALLIRYTGRRMRGPQRGTPAPNPEYLAWHREQVFRKPARVVD
ncbi:MAG: phosphorothioated DNA-binding restriction endonuclease [Gemmatimonadota bacterium]